MLTQSLQDKVDQYETNFQMLKSNLKWKVSSTQVLMAIASIYVIQNKPYKSNQLLSIQHILKKQTGFFSPLNADHRFILAALLDVYVQNPDEAFQRIRTIYQRMIQSGFKKDCFTYLSAFILYKKTNDSSHHDSLIDKAMHMYQEMRNHHFFLTSTHDYPFATMLALKETTEKNAIVIAETFYQELSKNGFKKGNDLQTMSHLLMLNGNMEPTSACVKIFDELTRLYKKPKAIHYPDIGLFTYIDEKQHDLPMIVETIEQLNAKKAFRWYKDVNVKTAFLLVMSERQGTPSMLEASISHHLHVINQATRARNSSHANSPVTTD
ncbi:DUF4003 family protein [Bacillus sp. NPDC077027]|uniref:DUF4003 family protein n=1 Tax=Bacillus sp. NPDC077027 TaxID=3390548 RepID=UPI003CFD651C